MELLAVGHIWIFVNLLEVRLLYFQFYLDATNALIDQRKISLAFLKMFLCVITCNLSYSIDFKVDARRMETLC